MQFTSSISLNMHIFWSINHSEFILFQTICISFFYAFFIISLWCKLKKKMKGMFAKVNKVKCIWQIRIKYIYSIWKTIGHIESSTFKIQSSGVFICMHQLQMGFVSSCEISTAFFVRRENYLLYLFHKNFFCEDSIFTPFFHENYIFYEQKNCRNFQLILTSF